MDSRVVRRISRATAVVMIFSVCSAWAMTATEARSWQEDLHFMARQMQEEHKSLYHSISAQDFAARVAALDARIPSLTRAQVIVEMARIVAAVGDGHTNIYPTRDPKIGFHTLPVIFAFFGSDLYVRAIQPEIVLELHDVKIRIEGDIAVVISHVHVIKKVGGQTIENTHTDDDVFRKRGGKWQMIVA